MAVAHWQSGLALCVLPLTIGLTSTALFVAATGRASLPGGALRSIRADLSFGARTTAVWSLALTSNTIAVLALGRIGGAEVLGQWNRAQAVARTPIDVLGRSSVAIIYPLFREPTSRDRRTVSLWGATFTVAFAAVVSPVLWILPLLPAVTDLVLGPGWNLAGEMAPFIWLATGISIMSLLAGSALESAAAFGVVLTAQAVSIAAMTAAWVAMAAFGDWRTIAIGAVIGSACAHGVQLVGAGRLGYISIVSVLRWYGLALAVGLVGCSLVMVCSWASLIAGAGVSGLLIVSSGTAVYRFRRVLPQVKELLGPQSETREYPT
jgi:hypothetical protein